MVFTRWHVFNKQRSLRRALGKTRYVRRFKPNKLSVSRPIPNKGNLYLFKRTQIVPIVLDRNAATADTITGHNIWAFTNTGNVSSAFSLNQLDGYTELTGLFDRYKICGVKWELSAYNSEGEVSTAWVSNLDSTSGTLKVHTVNDYDDNTNITSIAAMGQYKTYKRTSLQSTRSCKRYVKPCVLVMAYKSLVTTAYAPKRMYIDCNDNETPHYGIKFIIEEPRAWTLNQDHSFITLELRMTYYVSFKDAK